jgi:hypothetical protein
VEANFACTYGKKDCHRPGRQKGSGSRGRQQEGCELEGSAVPAVEATETLDDFGLSAALLGVGEDALQARLGLFEGGKDLAAEERDQGSRQGRGGLPAFTAGALLFDRQDHLMVTEELKSLTDRSFAYSETTLNMVEIQGAGGHVKERVDLGDGARNPQNAGHADEEIGQLELVGLKGFERRSAFASAGGFI